MSDLGRRIAAALTSTAITATELEALIAETGSAVTTAAATAEAEHAKAFELVAAPDATKARNAMEEANFTHARLCAVLPKLRQLREHARATEAAAQWRLDFDRVKAKRDEMAAELAEVYPQLTAQLVGLFRRVEVVDKECSRVNSKAPSGERHLRGVEPAARNLEEFTAANPSIAESLQLPDWEQSDRMAWPPPKPSLAVRFAMAMVPQHDPRYSADWAATAKADNVRRQQNEAKWAEEEAARQTASKLAYEAALRR